MLMGMIPEHKISTMREATAARERALTTMSAITRLHEEVMRRPDLSEGERVDKKQEIDRLRQQYKREYEPVDAFYKGLERRAKMVERTVAQKDPEIEHLREEVRRISERKGKTEHIEIERVEGEFSRRLKELESGVK
jgi:hypothetical protein